MYTSALRASPVLQVIPALLKVLDGSMKLIVMPDLPPEEAAAAQAASGGKERVVNETPRESDREKLQVRAASAEMHSKPSSRQELGGPLTCVVVSCIAAGDGNSPASDNTKACHAALTFPHHLQGCWSAVQAFALGALAVLLVDAACRGPLIAAEPNLATLLALCSNLEGYSERWASERRILAARIACSCIQRDAAVRQSIVLSGGSLSGHADSEPVCTAAKCLQWWRHLMSPAAASKLTALKPKGVLSSRRCTVAAASAS